MLAAYEDTLRWLAADGRFVFMLPRDLRHSCNQERTA